MFEEVKVSFEIRSFDSPPDDITKLLGIKPTEAWQKGDHIHPEIKHSPGWLGARDNCWLIRSGAKESEDIEVHLKKLMSVLSPKQAVIHELAQSCDAKVRVTATCTDNSPGLVFEPGLLKEIVSLGAVLDIDLWYPRHPDNK